MPNVPVIPGVTFTDAYNYSTSNDLTSAGNRARVGGSGFTVFAWNEEVVSFCRQVSHQSPQPVAQGVVPIHPLDSPYPVQLVTPQALTMGTLVLELYELYGENVWTRLSTTNAPFATPSSGGPVDLAGLFQAVANAPAPIHIYKIISPPLIAGKPMAAYTEEYHNVVISAFNQGETIEVGTMEVLKQLTVNYTHITQGGRNPLLDNSTQVSGNPPPGASR